MATYNIGPTGTPAGSDGKVYSTLCQPTTGFQGWATLQPGDTVNIYWKSTPYYEIIMLTASGTLANPITIQGVSNTSTNSQAMISGAGYTATGTNSIFGTQFNSGFNTSYLGNGVVFIATQHSSTPVNYITINNLDISGAYSGNTTGVYGTSGPNTFLNCDGTVTQWNSFAAAIYGNGNTGIQIINCTLHDSGLGLYINSNTDNGFPLTQNILVQGNYFYNNGITDEDHEHNNYCEALGITYQYNWFGNTRTLAGSALKDRSAGCIIRYNYIQAGANMLDLVEAQDSTGSITPAASYANTFVYGNIFDNTGTNVTAEAFWFGGDQQDGSGGAYRANCYFYYNTVISNVTGAGIGENYLWQIPYVGTNVPTVYSCNNIYYLTGATYENILTENSFGGPGAMNVYASDWISPGYTDGTAAIVGLGNIIPTSGTNPGNPGMVNLSGGNYQLATGSALIGVAGALPSPFMTAYGWGSSPATGFRDAAGPPTQQLNYFGITPLYGLTTSSRASLADLGAYQYGTPGPPTTATLAAPSPASGYNGYSSSNFTITLNNPAQTGGVSCVVTSSVGGDSIINTPIVIPSGYSTGTFFITPSSLGARTITLTSTTPSLTIASSPVTYTSVALVIANSIWPSSASPTNSDTTTDTSAVNLGVEFYSDVPGKITGVSFYKGTGNTGTHIGSLWSASGALLATATFTEETASGWQKVSFGSPISIASHTNYVASYFAPVGNYAADANYFASVYTNDNLHVIANGGLFTYSSGNAFPTTSFNSSNYWVDIAYALSGNVNLLPAVQGKYTEAGSIFGTKHTTLMVAARGYY